MSKKTIQILLALGALLLALTGSAATSSNPPGAKKPLLCTTTCSAAGLVAGQSAYIFKNVSTSRTNTTTLADDPDFIFTTVANGTYLWKLTTKVQQGAAVVIGLKFEMLYNAGGASFGSCYSSTGNGSGATTAFSSRSNNSTVGTGVTWVFTASTVDQELVCDGMFVAAGSASLHFQWAQNALDAVNAISVGNGTLALTRIN